MNSLKVLVIDDEKVIGNACQMVLGERGHDVTHCLTAAEGLHAIDHNAHDLILLDMNLPDIDGSLILKRIRETSNPSTVIVMTGYSTMANAVEAMKLGAVDYLAKPFTEDELLKAIQERFPNI